MVSIRRLDSWRWTRGIITSRSAARSARKRSRLSASRAVVELLGQALLELAHDVRRIDVLAHHVTRDRVEDAHQRADVLQVLVHGVGDAGILHLHHHRLAAAQLARCTCPSDAAANASCSKRAKRSSGGAPSSAVDHLRAPCPTASAAPTTAPTASTSSASAGKRSCRMLRELGQLHEGAAQLLRALDHPARRCGCGSSSSVASWRTSTGTAA